MRAGIFMPAAKVFQDQYKSYTWENKPAPATFGVGRIFISDVGINGGSWWRCTGTAYVPDQPITLHRLLTPFTSTNGTAEEVFAVSGPIPAGVLDIGRQISITCALNKSASTESTANLFKIGTNADGKTGATTISSSMALSAANRMMTVLGIHNVLGATSLQQVVIGGSTLPYGASSSAIAITPRTIHDVLANTSYISITGTKTTGGIETITCPAFEVVIS